jgi:hypothetical protein
VCVRVPATAVHEHALGLFVLRCPLFVGGQVELTQEAVGTPQPHVLAAGRGIVLDRERVNVFNVCGCFLYVCEGEEGACG